LETCLSLTIDTIDRVGYKARMTFIQWLSSQQHREDDVGMLAREVHAEWGRNWKEVGAFFHFGGQNWPKTISNLRRYLSAKTLEYLDPRFDYPPPVSKDALKALEQAWSEWKDEMA
jgi:hypothetical protein